QAQQGEQEEDGGKPTRPRGARRGAVREDVGGQAQLGAAGPLRGEVVLRLEADDAEAGGEEKNEDDGEAPADAGTAGSDPLCGAARPGARRPRRGTGHHGIVEAVDAE